MQVDLKYYKYIDPASGEVKKDVGLVTSRLSVKAKRKIEADNSLTTISEEKIHIVSERKPRVENTEVIEITKEEFDALDAESVASPKKIERLERFKEYRNSPEDRFKHIRERSLSKSEVKSEVKVVDAAQATIIEQKFKDLKKDKKDK